MDTNYSQDVKKQSAKGTTTVGITTENEVVLATEKRASMGNLIASKTAEKVYKITDFSAITISGIVGDGQNLAKTLRVESNLYEKRRGKSISIEALASMGSNIMRSFFFFALPLLGGVDEEPPIFTLDPSGGAMEEKYASTGSGSTMAYGVLEDRYEENMSFEDAKLLAVKSVESAMERDTASGDGITLAIITEKGFERVEDSEIEQYLG